MEYHSLLSLATAQVDIVHCLLCIYVNCIDFNKSRGFCVSIIWGKIPDISFSYMLYKHKDGLKPTTLFNDRYVALRKNEK